MSIGPRPSNTSPTLSGGSSGGGTGTVTGVTAGDATITVGGTSTAPTVKVTPNTFTSVTTTNVPSTNYEVPYWSQTLGQMVWQPDKVFDVRTYYGASDTDWAPAMRRAVTAAAAYMATTGNGAVVQMPTGRLNLTTPEVTANQPTFQAWGNLGIGIPCNLTSRLTIRGQGQGATTLALSSTVISAFYIAQNGANIHATYSSGATTVVATSIPQGTAKIGDMLVGVTATGVPGGTLIGPGSTVDGNGNITVGGTINLVNATTGAAVTTTSSGSSLGLVTIRANSNGLNTYGDVVQNVSFEDFDLDDNGATGYGHSLFGNAPSSTSSPQYYLSYQSLRFRRMTMYGYPYDPTQVTTVKGGIQIGGNHPINDQASQWATFTKDILFEDLELRDVHKGLEACSYVVSGGNGALTHKYTKIIFNRCSVDHTYSHGRPATTLEQTSFYVCAAGYGDDLTMNDCYSKGVGDDALEIGAMQRVLINRFHSVDPWFEGIMFRHSRDPIDYRSQEIIVNDSIFEATSTLAGAGGTPQTSPIAFDIDSSANSLGESTVGMGRFVFNNCTYRLQGFSYTGLTFGSGPRANNAIGWNFYGPIQSVEMNNCKFHLLDFSYNTASSVDLVGVVSNLTPAILNPTINTTSTAQTSPAIHKITNFEMVVDGGGATSTGTMFIDGLWTVGNGIIGVDGFEFRLSNMTSSLIAPSLLQINRGGNYGVQRFRRIRGVNYGTGSDTRYGVRIYSTGTIVQNAGYNSRILIEDSDTSWSSGSSGSTSYDIDTTNAPTNIGSILVLRDNKYSLAGGPIKNNLAGVTASSTIQITTEYLGVTGAAANTQTLPLVVTTPINRVLTIADEGANAATNNITILCAGANTFTDGTTSKVINTNNGFYQVQTNGLFWEVVGSGVGYAGLASPAFTGTPTAPTAAFNTNTTQLATTAFVLGQASGAAPVIDGTATIGTSTAFARADHVHPSDTTRATLASPTFTGVPAGPTATASTNTTQLATTAFVLAQASSAAPNMDGTQATGTSLFYARADHVHASDTSRAALASPTFTGVPAGPTATAGTNTTQFATTAFVTAAVSASTTGVSSYNTRTGAVVPASGDYTVAQVTGAAPLASPTFTGTPASVTAAVDTNTTEIATTAFVLAQVSATVPVIDGTASVGSGTRFALSNHVHPTDTTRAALAGPTFTGVPAAPTAAVSTNTTQVATTAFVVGQVGTATPIIDGTAAVGTSLLYARQDHVHGSDTTKANLASPTFTGTPLSTTAAVGTNTTQVATTAFVIAQAATATPIIDGTAVVGTSTTFARADHVHPTDTSRAALASPTFTGTPAAPTATAGTNTTQVATTAFVAASYAPLASPALTGTPTAPTPAAADNSTNVATTAFVIAQEATPNMDARYAAWGLKGHPFPIEAAAASTPALTSGRLEGSLLSLKQGMTVTGLVVALATLPSGLTGLYAALYSLSGTLLTSGTNNLSSTGLTATGLQTLAFNSSGTYTIPSDGCYYSTILAVGTTGPVLQRSSNDAYYYAIPGSSGVTLYIAKTGLTTPPSTLSGDFGESAPYWLAVY
jgi:hypothetical protein